MMLLQVFTVKFKMRIFLNHKCCFPSLRLHIPLTCSNLFFPLDLLLAHFPKEHDPHPERDLPRGNFSASNAPSTSSIAIWAILLRFSLASTVLTHIMTQTTKTIKKQSLSICKVFVILGLGQCYQKCSRYQKSKKSPSPQCLLFGLLSQTTVGTVLS